MATFFISQQNVFRNSSHFRPFSYKDMAKHFDFTWKYLLSQTAKNFEICPACVQESDTNYLILKYVLFQFTQFLTYLNQFWNPFKGTSIQRE